MDALVQETSGRSIRLLRITALRIVAAIFGLVTGVCVLFLVMVPVSALWPRLPFGFRGHMTPWIYVLIVGLGYTMARITGQLWRRQRLGAIVALGLCLCSILGNYVGPMKGTQTAWLLVAMIALLAVGWPELDASEN